MQSVYLEKPHIFSQKGESSTALFYGFSASALRSIIHNPDFIKFVAKKDDGDVDTWKRIVSAIKVFDVNSHVWVYVERNYSYVSMVEGDDVLLKFSCGISGDSDDVEAILHYLILYMNENVTHFTGLYYWFNGEVSNVFDQLTKEFKTSTSINQGVEVIYVLKVK